MSLVYCYRTLVLIPKQLIEIRLKLHPIFKLEGGSPDKDKISCDFIRQFWVMLFEEIN